MTWLQAKDRAFSTLASPVTDTATSWSVVDGSVFPASNFPVTCGAERCLCSSRTSNTLTVVREQYGSTKAAHAAGAIVSENPIAAFISELQGQSVTISVYALNALNSPQETVAGIHYVCTGTADQTIINTALTAMA